MKLHVQLAVILFMISPGLLKAEKPNVVIIYGDDVGFADVTISTQTSAN